MKARITSVCSLLGVTASASAIDTITLAGSVGVWLAVEE